jgi:hypothetical protein
MPCKKLLVLAGCVTTLALAGCDCFKGPQGKYDETAGQAKHRIWLAADGTVTRIETDVGGSWHRATPAPDGTGTGTKILDIKVYPHDNNLKSLKIEDGTQHGQETHPHTGGLNPPWNSHCHKVWYVGGQKYTSHC